MDTPAAGMRDQLLRRLHADLVALEAKRRKRHRALVWAIAATVFAVLVVGWWPDNGWYAVAAAALLVTFKLVRGR